MRVRATRLFAISGGGRRLAVNVFATAAAAYSMRIPANSTYTGSLARVRRSSDNLELDIGAAGAQVAQNRNFATASGWSLGTGVSYGTNQLTFTNATRIAGQDMGLVTGRSYRVCVVVNKTGAGPTSAMRLSTGNSASTETGPFTVIATNPPYGLNVFIGTITANGSCLVIGADTNLLSGSINFVSVQETTAIPGQNAWLNESALLAHVGINSGFITTWYDQSGNGRNATQTVTANQPRIVNAGVVDTFNSRPAMFNDGTRWLVTAGISALTTGPVTANGVGAPTTTQSYRYFQSIGDTFAGNVGWTIGTGAANNNFYASAPGIVNSGGTLMTANTAFVMTAVHTGTASSGFVNGSASTGTGNSFTYNVGTAPITIGSLAAAGTGSAITGYIFEQVYFANTNIATAQRQTLERNQGAAYGITVA